MSPDQLKYGAPVSSECEVQDAPAEYPAEHPTEAELSYEDYGNEVALIEARNADPDVISGYTMSQKAYAEQQFLIGPALLPRAGRMLLTAENGTGKSAVVMYMAACLATGKPLFGFTNTHKDKDYGKPIFPINGESRVFYLDYEIPEAIRWQKRMAPLLNEFGAEFTKNVFFARKPSDFRLENARFDLVGAFDRLLATVLKFRPDVLIIDPLSSTHSLDENSNQIKQALNNVDRLIDNSGCAAILVHHASTKKLRNAHGEEVEKSAKEKARGHSSITDWADFILHIEELKDKGNQAKSEKTLKLDFAKTRFSRSPMTRAIRMNLETMQVEPIRRGDEEE